MAHTEIPRFGCKHPAWNDVGMYLRALCVLCARQDKIRPQIFLHPINSLCYNIFALLDCVMVALRTLNPSV